MKKIVQIKSLTDNYIYVYHEDGVTLIIDPTEAAPVLEVLKAHEWHADAVLLTHHHADHTSGVPEIVAKTGCKVVGYAHDAHRLPPLDFAVVEGDEIFGAKVMFLPGHTSGHIAYYFKKHKLLFCGDVLFSLGCGRVFEGTMEEMFNSLQRIAALPDDTLIFCAHEYTQHNGWFALRESPENPYLIARMDEVAKLRKKNEATIPVLLGEEKRCNPFLFCADVESFTILRQKRNLW